MLHLTVQTTSAVDLYLSYHVTTSRKHNVTRTHLRQLIVRRLFEEYPVCVLVAAVCLGTPSVGGRDSAMLRPSDKRQPVTTDSKSKTEDTGYRSPDWRVVFIVTGDLW
jgi:hypothetical protein